MRCFARRSNSGPDAAGARHERGRIGLALERCSEPILRFAGLPAVSLFSSPALLEELSEILARTKFQKKIALSMLTVDEIVDLYSANVFVVRPFSIPRRAPDVDDDVVLGTALAARADFVVTGDRTLLSLGTYENVRILSVQEALDAVSTIGRHDIGAK